ncbi:unnamed protein product [Lactuca virosa]|uniref:Methyltransferase-like protein 13 n=1 Tax=Lactuca virosa TaxID=75947 RepID=A0AAU9NJV8_9ASTR|nr:unnamed protein product [Lactuca virosa]
MTTQFELLSEIDPSKFEAVTPSQFITFTMVNSLNHRRWLHAPALRVAVLDSPMAKADDESPIIAAVIVPRNRETDWTFCTESGHFQLLFKFHGVSRLFLIGNIPPHLGASVYKPLPVLDSEEQEKLKNELKPLLMSWYPKKSTDNDFPETLFLTDEDDVAYRVTLAKFLSPIVGEFLVEDVELVGGDDRNKQLRRRLRFKRMPKVIQSEALLIPIIPYDEATTLTNLESLRSIEGAKFNADTTVLVQQYLVPMVAGMFLIASHLNERIHQSLAPTALYLGVGGGVLLNFLDTEMGFVVTGVEADAMVISAARFHFGLNNSGFNRLIVGDAIETIQNFPPPKPEEDSDELKVDDDIPEGDKDDSKVDENVPQEYHPKFDVILVDLDSSEAKNGFSAPPPEFVKKPVFESLRSLLDDHGVLIIHVVSLNQVFYTTLVEELKENFHKVFGIDVGKQDNSVVMATVSPPSSIDDDNDFLKKLKSVTPGTNMDSIVEL